MLIKGVGLRVVAETILKFSSWWRGALDHRQVPPNCSIMRGHQPTHGLLRTALAVTFAFMSLFHGPVMTFAQAGSLMHETVGVIQPTPQRHHHHAAVPKEGQPSGPSALPLCNAFGCFVLLEALPVRLAAALLTPIGVLLPGIAKTMFAADIKPAIPPPRLQVWSTQSEPNGRVADAPQPLNLEADMKKALLIAVAGLTLASA